MNLEKFASVAGRLGLSVTKYRPKQPTRYDIYQVELGERDRMTIAATWLDYRNAGAVFLILDAIEAKGFVISVGSINDEDGAQVPGYGALWYDLNNCVPGSVEGCKTRTEAVLLAATALAESLEEE